MSDGAFSIDPDPPVHGKPVKICHPGPYPATITVTFAPGDSQDYSVPEPGCFTVDVPDNAISMNVHDEAMGVPDLSRGIA